MHHPADRDPLDISTHSRLKAAGFAKCGQALNDNGFNTQPPEGGWRRQTARAGR